MSKKTKILFSGLLLLGIGLISFFVRSYPLDQKGFAPVINEVNLAAAKNMYAENTSYLEGKNHVALSARQAKEEGIYSDNANQLTPLIYSKIFKYWKFDTNLPAYISVGIWAVISVLLFVLVWHLFNLKIAFLFFLIELVMPFVVKGVLWPGSYEFAMFFFTIGLMFYLWREKQTWQELVLSSVFLTLAFWARNAFLVSLAALFVYDIFKNKSYKRLILMLLPFILISTVFLQINAKKGIPNSYFISDSSLETFANLGHLFPDPYTYHYEMEDYLQRIKDTTEPNAVEYLEKYGYKVSLWTKVKTYIFSAKFYPQRIWRLVLSGGPIFLALMFAGFIWLYKKKRKIFILFFSWISIWYLLLIVLKTNNWNHYLEISFPLVLMAALGAYWLISSLAGLQRAWIVKVFLSFVLCLVLAGQLGLSVKWLMHEQYNYGMDTTIENAQALKEIKRQQPEMFDDEAVIAIGSHPGTVYNLSYLTDMNFIYFAPDTIIRLFEEGDLDSALEKMGITYFIGYGDELSWGLYQNGYSVLLP